MAQLLISDLHLSATRPAVSERFLRFLREPARECQRLYILGDLFDVWIGDDEESEPIPAVRAALAELTATGVTVALMGGNRDFLLGAKFARSSGVERLPDPTHLTLDGVPTLLMHGDLLCSDDLAYQQLRSHLRDPATIAAFLAQPLAVRRQLAAQYRQQSGEATSLKASDIMDVNPQTVVEYLTRYPSRWLIHGHTHRPGCYPLVWPGGEASRWVLPEWHPDQGGYLAVRGGIITSHTF